MHLSFFKDDFKEFVDPQVVALREIKIYGHLPMAFSTPSAANEPDQAAPLKSGLQV